MPSHEAPQSSNGRSGGAVASFSMQARTTSINLNEKEEGLIGLRNRWPVDAVLRLPNPALHAATFALGALKAPQQIVETELFGPKPSLHIFTHVGMLKLAQLPGTGIFCLPDGCIVVIHGKDRYD